MAIRFEITGDNNNFLNSIEGSKRGVHQLSKDVEKSGASIESMFNRIKVAAAAMVAGISGKELAQQMVNVRGEFQKLEISFKTMLGSGEKANALMSQLVTTAAVTPFDLKGIASGAKQLLAYGMEAEKVNDTIVRLGDIAAGLDQPLGDLIYLYGTTMAQGRMYTQDLNQFMGRGIPMLGELAKMFGVTETQVRGLVTEGKVGFAELEQVIHNLTSEGGRFGGLMKEQSASWPGQISNIGDAIDNMFNKIGKDNEGIVNGVLGTVSSLVENYEQVGRVLTGLVATYGTYKVAVMAVSAVQTINNMITKQAAVEKALAAAASITLGDAEAIAAAKTKILSLAMNKARLSVAALGKTMLANPYVLAATAIAALVAGYMSLETETERMQHAEERYNEEKEKAIEIDKKRKEQANEYVSIAENESNATDTRNLALRNLMALYPEIFAKYDTEYERLKHLRDIKIEIAELEGRREYDKKRSDLAKDKKRLAELQKKWREMKSGGELLSSDEYDEMRYLFLKKIPEQEKVIAKEDANMNHSKRFNLQRFKDRMAAGEDPEKLIAEIDREMGHYDNLLSKMKLRGKKYGQFKGSDVVYSADELQSTKLALRDIRNELNAPKNTSGGWVSAYANELKEAEAELNRFKNSKDKMTEAEFNKGMKERQDAVAAAKKNLQSTGFTTSKTSHGGTDNKAEERLDAQSDLDEKMHKLERENERALLNIMEEGRDKRLATIEFEYNERKDRINEHIKEMRELNIKAYGNDRLTQEQLQAIADMNYNNEAQRTHDKADLLKEDEAAMRAYLMVYGSLMQQKTAINAEYDKRISDAQSDGERKTLEKEREDALSRAEFENLKEDIDWTMVFGDLDNVSEETLERLLQKLKEFIEKSKNLSVEGKKEITDAITKIDDEFAERKPFKALGNAFDALKDSTDACKKAQEAYNKAVKEGTEEEKANAKATLEAAMNAKRKAQTDATKALHSAAGDMHDYVDAAGSLTNLMEVLGVNPPAWMQDFLGGIDDMAKGLEKIDFTKPMTAITGTIDALSGLFKSVFSIGGLINFNNSNAKEVQETIDRLTDRNEKLQGSIEDLTSEMELGRGAKSVKAYEEAVKAQKEMNSNYLEMAKAKAGYHGSHHSWNHYWGGFTPEQMAWIKQNVNADFNGDLFSLTPEEMKKLRANIEIWESIQNTGKGRYGLHMTEMLDDYIDQAGKVDEMTDKMYASLTGVSFDNVYDNFVDMLMSLEDPTKEAAENLGEIFMKAMLSYRISEMFETKLKEWWDDFGKAMQSDGIDEDEKKALMERYLAMVKEAEDTRDEVASIVGYDIGGSTQQGASKNAYATASQESIDELSGRALSNQISLSKIDTNVLAIVGKVNAIVELQTSGNIFLEDVRNMMITANTHLQDIAKLTKMVYVDFSEKLDAITNNTKNL